MLKFLPYIAVAIFIAYATADDISAQNAQLYIFEENINATLKNLSDALAQHDPLLITNIHHSFEHELGRYNFELQDVRVSGFSKFWATKLKISMVPPAVTFDIHFEEIHILVPYYNFDAFAVFIPFYGSGFMNLRSTNINLGGSAKIRMGSSGISAIKKVQARFNLEKSNLVLSGILHNEPLSQIISTSTTECYPEFVNAYGDRLGQLAGKKIEDLVNAFLNPKSADETEVDYDTPHDTPFKGGDSFKVGNATIKYLYEL